jgi:hypothetical protein
MATRRSYTIILVGGPHNGQQRTIEDVTLPLSYTDWDGERLALYRPVHHEGVAAKLDGCYRFDYEGPAAPPIGLSCGCKYHTTEGCPRP